VHPVGTLVDEIILQGELQQDAPEIAVPDVPDAVSELPSGNEGQVLVRRVSYEELLVGVLERFRRYRRQVGDPWRVVVDAVVAWLRSPPSNHG